MKSKTSHNSQRLAVASKKNLPKKDPFKDDMPGWVWVLTIQDMPDDLREGSGVDEEDYNALDINGDIVGCYATKVLMVEDMKKMGPHRYSMHHMRVEGWTK